MWRGVEWLETADFQVGHKSERLPVEPDRVISSVLTVVFPTKNFWWALCQQMLHALNLSTLFRYQVVMGIIWSCPPPPRRDSPSHMVTDVLINLHTVDNSSGSGIINIESNFINANRKCMEFQQNWNFWIFENWMFWGKINDFFVWLNFCHSEMVSSLRCSVLYHI